MLQARLSVHKIPVPELLVLIICAYHRVTTLTSAGGCSRRQMVVQGRWCPLQFLAKPRNGM